MQEIYEMIIGHIKTLCDEAGWSNYQLAKYSGLPQSTLSNIMRGRNKISLDSLIKICNGFGKALSEFFAEMGQ